jgi:pseudouridine kinase
MNQSSANRPDILCIGSVLWDVIGTVCQDLPHGADMPGAITRHPGGVALNVALALRGFGLSPAALTVIGKDREGKALMEACIERGIDMQYALWSDKFPTDQYMAIEDKVGLVAAIADARSLEQAGDAILAPLTDGRLARPNAPFTGTIALDGNLPAPLLQDISISAVFARADLRVAPASPGKAMRLAPFIAAGRGTLYVNLEEAGLLCNTQFEATDQAAQALITAGAARVLVTHGENAASFADKDSLAVRTPPQVAQVRITGAGDTCMAAHIAAELNGANQKEALETALEVAARFVSSEE